MSSRGMRCLLRFVPWTRSCVQSSETRNLASLYCRHTQSHTALSQQRGKSLQPCSVSFSTSPPSRGEEHIQKSPLRDIHIPDSPFLPHYIMEKWNKFGNTTALVNGETGQALTYSELKDQITKAGSALVKQGYGKGDVITILSPNCPEFCVMYMAAMSIGMTVSSVNPLYTPDELTHSVNHSESKLLALSPLLVDTVRKALPQCTTIQKCIVLGSADGMQPLSSLLEDDGQAFPENIDYDSKNDTVALPYSSGTTGLPKGVMLTSYNIVANLEQLGTAEMLDPRDGDMYVCVLPMFHAFAQAVSMLLGCRSGATNITMAKFDPVAYLEHIQKHRPTHLHVVPPIMLFFANHPIVEKYDLSSVRYIFYAAAPMPTHAISLVQDRFGLSCILSQGYGMTEASPALNLNPSHDIRPDTAGVPTHNTYMKIRDLETGEALGPNKEGEICHKGPQVMKGYFKNQKATEDTIIDGWLHTGDIGYYNEECYLIITDRLKELIKYKGFQVAPAELEALLLTHPAVLDAAVIGKPDEMAGELPRAYIVLRPDCKATEENIQSFIEEKAASYKHLRGGVEFRSEIPKSASGKILRRYLKDDLLNAK